MSSVLMIQCETSTPYFNGVAEIRMIRDKIMTGHGILLIL